jgi:hypothetical protein
MRRIVVSCVATTFMMAALTAQSRQTELAALRSQFVAPDVVATWSLAAGGPGHDKLLLLVLWRGTPGWGRRAGSFGTRGEAVGSPEERQGGGPRLFRQQILVGNLTFDVYLDLQSRLVQIDNHEFDLRSSNVFLIDRVDESSTPRGVQPMWVEPEFPVGTGVEAIIRREPALRAFLRCEP